MYMRIYTKAWLRGTMQGIEFSVGYGFPSQSAEVNSGMSASNEQAQVQKLVYQ